VSGEGVALPAVESSARRGATVRGGGAWPSCARRGGRANRGKKQ